MSLVLVAVEDRGEAGTVARVTVNNPDQRNALGNAGKRELAEAIEALADDTRLRLIVLTGAGDRSFISGANIAEMATFEHGHAMEGPGLTYRVCNAVRRAPVPVIARVNGWCLGAGLEIAASCDMRVAVDTARFGMPEVLFGLPSGMEACLLPQLIGWGKTRELVFTGRHIDAREAAECRLVERVVAADCARCCGGGVGGRDRRGRVGGDPRAEGVDPGLGADVDCRCSAAGDPRGGCGTWVGRGAAADARVCRTAPLKLRSVWQARGGRLLSFDGGSAPIMPVDETGQVPGSRHRAERLRRRLWW